MIGGVDAPDSIATAHARPDVLQEKSIVDSTEPHVIKSVKSHRERAAGRGRGTSFRIISLQTRGDERRSVDRFIVTSPFPPWDSIESATLCDAEWYTELFRGSTKQILPVPHGVSQRVRESLVSAHEDT